VREVCRQKGFEISSHEFVTRNSLSSALRNTRKASRPCHDKAINVIIIRILLLLIIIIND
jgi:hypothetical protein